MAGTGPKQFSNQRVSVEKISTALAAVHVVQLDSTGGIVSGGAGGSTQVSVRDILTSSGVSVMDSTNNAIGVTIRAGSAAGTEYTDGDVDATVSGGAILFDNSSNTLRPVTIARGLPVNVVAGSAASTTVQVSSVGGVVVNRIIDRDSSTQVAAVINSDPPSTTYGLAVRQVGAVAASTTVQVSSVGGVVAVAPASSGATGFFAVRLSDGSTFITDSTQRALRVTSVDVGGSTQVTVSSVGGAVIVRSSKADALVTVYQSTAADLLIEPRLSTANANSSAYLPVRITDGTQFQALLAGFTDGSTTSTLAAPGVAFNNGSNATMRLAGSSTPLPVHLRTSSGADMGDSTNTALRVNVVAGSAASTTVQVSSVGGIVVTRIIDRDQSTQVAAVLNGTPDSTVWALAIRQVGATPGSTTVNVSSLAGNVTVSPLSSGATGFFAVRVSDGSTFLLPSIEYTDGSTTSTLVAGALSFNNGSNATMRLAGSSTPFPVHIRTDSGASVMDSTNGAIKVNIVAGAGSGGTALADQTTFSTNVTNITPAGGIVVSGASDVPAGEAGAFRMSSVRALWVNPVDSTGGEITDSTNRALRVFQVASSAGAGSTEVTVRQSTYTDFNTLSRIADRDASTQVANVTNTTPASTAYALAVREAAPSTGPFVISSVVGPVTVRSSAANALVTVYQSTAADLNVTVAGYSTTVQVSSVGGIVKNQIVDRDQSTQVAAVLNDAPASTVWALAVRQVGGTPGSTTVNVSSLAGAVIVRSSAADALQTAYQSTYTDFNSLSRLADRDNSTKVAAVLSDVQPASTAYGVVVRLPAPYADSTNNAIRVFQAASSAGAGSTEVTVRQSTYTDFNTLSRIADRDQSTQVAAVLNDVPASTVWALAVRQVGAAATSTTVNVSSLAGNVTVSPLSSGATGFFAVRVSDGSTFLQPSIEYTDGSTVSTLVGAGIAYNNGSNATMRLAGVTQPLPVQMRSGTLGQQSTTSLITSTHSTAVYALISSVASMRHKITAIYVGSTHTHPSTILFLSSLAQTLWAVNFGSGSSGITGVISAKNAPDFFFATEAQAALNVVIEGGSSATSTTIARVSVSYFSEA